jgi:4-hydroxybenzoate polyprenyltransferase
MSIRDLVQSLRPAQWTKNLFVFAALVFAQQALAIPLVLRAAAAFGVFCLLSGSMYVLNDLHDADEDRRHPKKARRPIAAGRIAAGQAFALSIILGAGGLAAAFVLGFPFFVLAAAYVALQVAYTVKLKHVVILDVFIVAAGFVLRVAAGGAVIDVPISSWLLICMTLLALFVAMGKRRHEIVLLEGEAAEHRPILREYSAYLLDQMISVVTASTLVAYCLYTVSEETVRKFGTADLIYTMPFVLFGIFRYLYLVHQKGLGGSPEELVVKDKPLAISILLWIAAVGVILYLI